MTAAKRVLRYLKGTKHHGLYFSKHNKEIFAYSDSSYGDHPDRKSTHGHIVFAHQGPIVWTSKRTSIVA